jgi:hypothetical protein
MHSLGLKYDELGRKHIEFQRVSAPTSSVVCPGESEPLDIGEFNV